MNGFAKKIIVSMLIAIVIVSTLAVMLSLKREKMKEEQPVADIIYSGINVKNPLQTVDEDEDEHLDSLENVNFDVSEEEIKSSLDENNNEIPDTLELGEEGYQELPEDENSQSKLAMGDNYTPGMNEREYLKPPILENERAFFEVFPGYGEDVERAMQNDGRWINLQERVKRGIYGIPIPDLEWIESQGKIRRFLLPMMHFGPNGFNWTEFNVTKFRNVVRYDNDSDGNPEYYREVSYLNLTQDENKNGVYEIEIIRYHMVTYWDNNSDGNADRRKWIDALYYGTDTNENNVTEEKAVMAVKGVMYDNDSDGRIEYSQVRAIGNETVDETENKLYECHIVMMGNLVRYDNNSDGNWEYVHGYFASKGIEDENEDGKPEIVVVSVKGYKMKDENDDGNFEYTKYIHWRYCKKDGNGDNRADSLKAMASEEIYYDNTTDGYPEYINAKILGITYEDYDGDGRNESLMKGFAQWKVINRDDDSHNNLVEFRLALINESSPLEDNAYADVGKLYLSYIHEDNNSDGNVDSRRFQMLGFWYHNATAPKGEGATTKEILYLNTSYRDENSDGNPEVIESQAFYRKLWDKNRDGIYEMERGLGKESHEYDSNSNGTFEDRALRSYGYMVYRNSTTGNITKMHLVALKGNATNLDDNGIAEFQNYTFLVINKIDENGNGNMEYVEIRGVQQRQWLNDTGLINVTVMGKYWFKDSNDNGLRDRYRMEGIKFLRIDYDLDGKWDLVKAYSIYHSGSDE